MHRQIALTKDTDRELGRLADTLGVPREAALYYALRLVNACIREGLLTGEAAGAWPQEAAQCGALPFTGTQGKVIHFSRGE